MEKNQQQEQKPLLYNTTISTWRLPKKNHLKLSESSYLLQILANQVPGHWPNPEFQDPFFSFSFFSFFRQRRENHHGQLPMQTQGLSEIIPGKWKKTITRGQKKNQTTERTRARQRRQTRQRREETKSLHRGEIGRKERRTPGPVITGNPRGPHHIVDKCYRSQAVALRVLRFIYEENRRIRSSVTFNYIGNSMFIQIICIRSIQDWMNNFIYWFHLLQKQGIFGGGESARRSEREGQTHTDGSSPVTREDFISRRHMLPVTSGIS